MIILDTNVLSEIVKPLPSPVVMRWFASLPARQIYTTSITAAEISYGIQRLAGDRRRKLEAATESVFDQILRGHVLSFDHKVASHFGRVVTERMARGRRIEFADAAIAAIARHHHAAVATHNVDDFDELGLDLINPWEEALPRPAAL